MMFGRLKENCGGEHGWWRKPLLGAAIGMCLGVAFIVLAQFGLVGGQYDEAGLHERFIGAGLWGPLLVVFQSAVLTGIAGQPILPIALAAHSAFGSVGGALCLLIGAFLGAMMPFAAWRLIGQPLVTLHFVGRRESLARLGSQNVLMAIMFVGHLLPAMPHSYVSLVAGAMTLLTPGRYAIAVAAGLGLSSIGSDGLLDYFEPADIQQALWSMAVFAALVLIAATVRWVMERRRPASQIAEDGRER